MTRGKHAAQAERRREVSDLASQVDGYQHAIRRLTAENAKLRDDLAESRRLHTQDVRTLKASLDEGLSPEVAALRGTVERLRGELDRARRSAESIRRHDDRMLERLCAHFRTDHGMTSLEATEEALNYRVEDTSGLYIVDAPGGRPPRDSDKAIQRARGQRK